MSDFKPPHTSSKPRFAHPGRVGVGEIVFSFEYFMQKENYGLSNIDIQWIVNFLSSLKLYSKNKLDYLNAARGPLHYHKLVYKEDDSKATISKSDFNYISHIINNQQIEIFQTRIHKTHGRIVFFTYESTAYLLLIDPHHNIYLTETNPQIVSCHKLQPDDTYGKCVLALETFCSTYCISQKCQYYPDFLNHTKGLNETRDRSTKFFYIPITDNKLIEDIEAAQELIGSLDFKEILEKGMDAVLGDS